MSVNKVILIGNVGKDPETKFLESGNIVSNFSLATSETYKNKAGEKVTNTEWHNIVVWGKLAEITEKFIKKGSQVYLEGKIKTRSYDKDGEKRYVTEIYADTIQMIGSKKEGSESKQEPEKEKDDFDGSAPDDLPF